MISIAIVEDIEDIRESLEFIIADKDDFDLAYSFPDAEKAMDTLSKDPVDVVLMDIHLPGMSGIECVQKLKLIHPEMHFIMCTIFLDDESVFKALKAGATGYILKNENHDRIVQAILDLIAGGSPMSPEIARKVIQSFQRTIYDVSLQLLTKRENELLSLLAKGYRYKEIADQLFISTETVRKHINNIYQKLQVQSRMEAVNKVFGEKH